ncbi:hypothetical protein OB2597_04385 [Pseudooceanicola batsensis HTCC2597]|uniref:Uncharacterized protein n=1 Tax=Pseudooceanicola batsensis (strain ATCC BAA-863 / DSM 15984 / KCTC 12145 / HTCC2597) TaxID=252305 RepID=A3U3K9_PSEBH|nr:VPLPA-CTERM sorting domain-containing protein [Pseudooceanicola batsensis]EAQ01211.1 hypothetical protein OB2597_04385 [Pseudooceanicola batsensis HTCC2597]
MNYMTSILGAAAVFLGVQSAEAAPVTYDGITFPEGDVSFADAVHDYSPGSGFATSGNCQTASLALGAPNFTSGNCDNYVSLGGGGSITLRFTDNALTTSGDDTPDLHIFEIGSATESIRVEISVDASSWIDFGYFSGQPSSLDIDAKAGVVPFEKYYYVRLTDNPGLGPHEGVYSGADIDAVGAISSTAPAIPLPASGLLLLGGVAGLGALRRRARG